MEANEETMVVPKPEEDIPVPKPKPAKNPKRVEQGKRLAAYNKKKKEELAANPIPIPPNEVAPHTPLAKSKMLNIWLPFGALAIGGGAALAAYYYKVGRYPPHRQSR
jgi:hypothetical protein